MKVMNPIINADFPGADIIRVGEVYYMLCGTFHFYPGGVILRSYDLTSWEIAGYVYESLEGDAKHRLMGERSNYGQGMWSGCIRYHDGKFYVLFTTHDPVKTYIFVSDRVDGEWERREVNGIFQDGSLLFDEDGEVYCVYGYENIYLTQLNEDLTGPKEGGVHKRILSDTGENILEYSGARLYKINGNYYLFVLNRPGEGGARKIQYCFKADSVDGTYEGREVVLDACKNLKSGVARGGIVDTPNGEWYGFLQMESGAAGRFPLLFCVDWEEGFPLMKEVVNKSVGQKSTEHSYEPLFASDDFSYPVIEGGCPKLKKQWQWNHEPRNEFWGIKEEGGFYIRMGKICTNLVHAQNTLTQRMAWPKCAAEVTVDASGLKEGDFAGICALQGCYGMIGITKDMGSYYLVMIARQVQDTSFMDRTPDYMPGTVIEKQEIASSTVRLRINVSFDSSQDTTDYFYKNEKDRWFKFGAKHNLYFKVDHFSGCRFGLFGYATKNLGGEAVFRDFEYIYE